MSTFKVPVRVQNVVQRRRSAELPDILVDCGRECTWLPSDALKRVGVVREKKDLQFQMANGQIITRPVGFAVLHYGDRFTVDEVVFAEEGDLSLLGARTLEGLNLRVDSRLKKLVAAGPLPAA